MFFNYYWLAQNVIWIAHALFCFALFPQIWLNYKLKSTSGLSDLLLIGYLNGYISYFYYSYLLDFPLAYKVMVPFAMALVLIMAFQRFLYSSLSTKRERYLLLFYILNISIAIAILPLTMRYPGIFGYFFGWAMMIIWATYQIPQVWKVFVAKSVVGFSLSLVSLVAFGDLIEFIVALVLGFPIPTLLNDFRGVLIYIIFYLQFWHYKEEKQALRE